MTDIERLDELEKIIQEKVEERNKLKLKINREKLMNLQGECYMVLNDDVEYLMFDKYNEKTQSIGCWSFLTYKDWNDEKSYIIEKLHFQSFNDLPHSMQWIRNEDFEEHLKKYFSEIKAILFKEDV